MAIRLVAGVGAGVWAGAGGRLSVHTSTKRFYRKGARRTRKNKERIRKEKPVLFGRYPVYAVAFGRYLFGDIQCRR